MSGQRASGWGNVLSAPPYRADDPPGAPKISEAGGMLQKSRLGKGQGDPLSCQNCGESDELVQQLPCLRVLCNGCATEHVREGECSQC